jgi:hypothetical protein
MLLITTNPEALTWLTGTRTLHWVHCCKEGSTEHAGLVMANWISVPEVFGSNIGQDIGYADGSFLSFSPFPPGKYLDNISIIPPPVPSRFFPFYHSFHTVILTASLNTNLKQEVLGRTNRLLSLIRHGPYWKRRVQQFSCFACIRYRGNVSTEPLPINDRGIFTEPLPSNDKGIHRHTNTQQRDLLSIPCFFSKIGK